MTDMVLDEGSIRRGRMTPAMVLRSRWLPTDSTVLAAIDGRMQLRYAPWMLTWRWGYNEIVARAGPPHFTGKTGNGLIVAQYPHPRVSFVPSGSIFLNHLDATAESWSLHEPEAFEFINGWLDPIRELQHQIAWFRRGDSARVVAAVDIRADSVYKGALISSLVMQRDFDRDARQFAGNGDSVVRFDVGVPAESTLVSLELRAANRSSGRTRLASGPPPMPDQRVKVSDILLVDGGQSRDNPTDLSSAAPRALGFSSFSSKSNLVLFWEMYGLQAGEKPAVQLTLTRDRGSFVGGLIRGLLGSRGADSLSLSWEDFGVTGAPIESRSLGLTLNTLDQGVYTLMLKVQLAGQQPVVTRRRISVWR